MKKIGRMVLLIFAVILMLAACGKESEKYVTYEANTAGSLGSYQIKTLLYDDGFSVTGLGGTYETEARFIVAEVEIGVEQQIEEGYEPLSVVLVDSAKREFNLYEHSEDVAAFMQQNDETYATKKDALMEGETKKVVFVFEIPRESLTKSLRFSFQEESAVYHIEKVRDGVNDLNICFDATKCPY